MLDVMTLGNTRRIKKLARESKRISHGQTNLSQAYQSLTIASSRIQQTIQALKERDFAEHKKVIRELNLDEGYKDGLVAELESSRTKAVETLEPLKDKAEKLRGNMVVAQEKSLQFLAIIRAQSEVAKAGEVQVSILNALQETGENLGQRIDSLLSECERINSVTDAAIAPFQGTSLVGNGSFLGNNPITGPQKVAETG